MALTALLFIILTSGLLYFRSAIPNKIKKTWITAFLLSWSFVLTLSSINPYGLYKIDSYTYFIFLTFIFSYSFGFTFKNKISNINEGINNYNLTSIDNLVTSRVLTFILILVFSIISYFTKKYLDYIILAGAIEAREARFFIGKVFQSGIEIAAFTYIIIPAVWFSMFTFSYCTIFDKIKHINWFLSLLIIIAYAAFGAGRNIFIETSLIIFLIHSTKQSFITNKTRSNKIALTLLIIIFTSLSIFATAFRTDTLSDLTLDAFNDAFSILTENFLIYFLGSIRAFQHAFNNPNQYFQYSFGFLTFSGLDEILSYSLKLIGFNTDPYSWKFAPILFQEISIGQHHDFNALYSAVYNYYFDFDLPGVILFGWIFGNLCSNFLTKFLNTNKPEYLFISSVLFTSSIWSILNWKLQSGEFITMIIAPLIMRFLTRVKIFKNHEY